MTISYICLYLVSIGIEFKYPELFFIFYSTSRYDGLSEENLNQPNTERDVDRQHLRQAQNDQSKAEGIVMKMSKSTSYPDIIATIHEKLKKQQVILKLRNYFVLIENSL